MKNSDDLKTNVLLTAIIRFVIFIVFGCSSIYAYSNYLEQKEFVSWLDHISEKHQFESEELTRIFKGVKAQKKVLKAISKPAEKSLLWPKYKKIFINDTRISGGRNFHKKYEDILIQANRKYEVPQSIIIAIIGVETRYGKNKGHYPVLDTLTTLAFDYPPRKKFFRRELEYFLLLTREMGFDPSSIKGSYAGAMGFPQFISSSYRNYAVDFDQNGNIDLLNSVADAIGSVANYFKEHGWVPNGPVAVPVQLSKNQALLEIVDKSWRPERTWAELVAMGASSDMDIPKDQLVTIFSLDHGDERHYWLGFNNFYVITRYNKSHLYAMAVYELSEAIAKQVQIK